MNRWQAQYSFWSRFGIPAYNEQTSIDEELEQYPYISYEAVSGEIDQVSTVSASLWYKSNSWEAISLKSDEIEAVLDNGGVTVPTDTGLMWVHKANLTPFAQPRDSGFENNQIKCMALTVEIEFL